MAINEQSGFSAQGTSSTNGSAVEGDVIHHASRMAAEAKAFGRSISATGARLNTSLDLSGRVQRNPIGSVLIAAGIGYVLGGGLFSPVTKKALKLGLRLAIIPFVKGQIEGLASSAGASTGEGF